MNEDVREKPGLSGLKMKIVLMAVSAIGAFFLLAEHRAHVLSYLPWLLLGGCLLMHVFMHGGHGHGGHGGNVGDPTGNDATAPAGDPPAPSHSSHGSTSHHQQDSRS